MHKTCKNCGTSNLEHARFCGKCGDSLHSHEHTHERTPAEQAIEISDKAKVEVNKITERTKNIWSGLSKSEKIIAVGGIVGIIAFVLPWVSANGRSLNGFSAGSDSGTYLYLLPLLMIVSLVLLYFTQGASDTRKALTTRWQIIIGSVASTVGLFIIIFISTIGSLLSQMMGGLGSIFGRSGFGVDAGVGLYLYVAGTIAIFVGAFRLQGELLRRVGSRN